MRARQNFLMQQYIESKPGLDQLKSDVGKAFVVRLWILLELALQA